jgi:hypothetical protein
VAQGLALRRLGQTDPWVKGRAALAGSGAGGWCRGGEGTAADGKGFGTYACRSVLAPGPMRATGYATQAGVPVLLGVRCPQLRASGFSITPASRRVRFTLAAIFVAPGVSPWMQMVSAWTGTWEPSEAVTLSCSTMLSACAAACWGSRMSASLNLRERSVPSGS